MTRFVVAALVIIAIHVIVSMLRCEACRSLGVRRERVFVSYTKTGEGGFVTYQVKGYCAKCGRLLYERMEDYPLNLLTPSCY